MTSLEVHHNFPLKTLNTFGMDVIAEQLVILRSVEALQTVLATNELPIKVLGGGSNILFTENVAGLLLKNEIDGIDIMLENDHDVLVKVGGGVVWNDLVIWAVEKGLGGIENLSLIPGTVGAAPIQNIGAYGVELKDVFHSLDAIELHTGKPLHFNLEQCQFGYRDSVFKREWRGRVFIVSVYIKLEKTPVLNTNYGDIRKTLEEMRVANPTIRDVSKAIVQIRSSKLPNPMVIGNAGSFFKNPEIETIEYQLLRDEFPDIPGYQLIETTKVKVPAGWLIEQAGWKGYRKGDAGCHERQALVLVNFGKAKGKEIIGLAEEIQRSVKAKFGIEITPEVNVW